MDQTPAGAKRKGEEDITPRALRARTRIMNQAQHTDMSLDVDPNDPRIANHRESPNQILSTNMPSDAVCTVSFADFRNYMTKEITGMKTTICSEIGASIDKVSEKVMVNAVTIAEVEKEVKAIKKSVAPESLRKEIREIAGDVMLGGGRTGPNGRSRSESDVDDIRKYWWARRCLRISPISEAANGSLWPAVEKFVLDELLVPESDMAQDSVESVRRIRNTRRSKITDEALVVFKDIETRDNVARHATNLAAWDGKTPRPSLRMEIPGHLNATFKMLERHGHTLKTRHGADLKRHIRFDDDELDLVLDVKLPKEDNWTRLSPQYVRELKRNYQRQDCDRVRDKLSAAATSAGAATGANAVMASRERTPSLPTSDVLSRFGRRTGAWGSRRD